MRLLDVCGWDSNRTRRRALTSLVLVAMATILLSVLASGCVRRTIRITSEPPNARVFLNDQELGPTEVSTEFLWYGDYDVVIRMEGYETLMTNWRLKRPWYQYIPIDFIAEVMWPGEFHDVHSRHFVLSRRVDPTSEELIERAQELRVRALTADD